MQPVSVGHYENFPVASLLCPPAMRPAVRAIYHFSRTADDIADEGDAPPAQRQAELARYRQALQACADGQPPGPEWRPVFAGLQPVLQQFKLPVPLLDDLLDAFIQDTHNPRYADRAHLLDYCRRSANPIGRLLLHLHGVGDALSLQQSDAICSALQLINFWQDLSVDLPRGRHYVPLADAARLGLTLDDLPGRADDVISQALVRDLCQWAADLMHSGAPLALRVPGRLGWELRGVVQGGLRILETIGRMRYRSLSHRPTIGTRDLPVLAWRALRMRASQPTPGFRLV